MSLSVQVSVRWVGVDVTAVTKGPKVLKLEQAGIISLASLFKRRILSTNTVPDVGRGRPQKPALVPSPQVT